MHEDGSDVMKIMVNGWVKAVTAAAIGL